MTANVTGVAGVPDYTVEAFFPRRARHCLLIPVINENGRIAAELARAQQSGVDRLCDIVILDGGSTDGSVTEDVLRPLGVCALLTKTGQGKQGAQLRMGFHWALDEGYEGIITIDGNNKDSIESTPLFIEKLNEGYDLVQGSRFVKGGRAIHTPPMRYLAVRLLHAPLISLAARQWFTDTTNAFRAYSPRYLLHPEVQLFRDVFSGYELLAYLSVRATQLGLRATEVPVTRAYPSKGKTPTKISPVRGSAALLGILFRTLRGVYHPHKNVGEETK